jgi:uncharacterized membrane protein
MITIDYVYLLAGLILACITVLVLRDRTNPRRFTTALFWGLYAAAFLFGSYLPGFWNGILGIALAVVVGFGGVRVGRHVEATTEEREARASRLGNRLFIPALAIPVVTLACAIGGKYAAIRGRMILEPANVTLIALAIGSIVALVIALAVTRDTVGRALGEARRLTESIGWAAVLPQLLATLGALFAAAGVGDVIAHGVTAIIPAGSHFWVVVAYAVGMALFTMIMGNAFAAFPVLTAGIGLPLIVHQGGNPAALAAIGMFSGYCGTLMTPMAANFNIVPAALLELPDKNAVIKVQVPTALLLLLVNIGLMYFLVFR